MNAEAVGQSEERSPVLAERGIDLQVDPQALSLLTLPVQRYKY
jgi:hypothetical protein